VSDSIGAIPGWPAVRLSVELDLLMFLTLLPMSGVVAADPSSSSSLVEVRLMVELARLRFLLTFLLGGVGVLLGPPSLSPIFMERFLVLLLRRRGEAGVEEVRSVKDSDIFLEDSDIFLVLSMAEDRRLLRSD